MVIGNEEARISTDIHNFGNALACVCALKIGLTFVKYNLISVVNRISEKVFRSVPHRLNGGFGINCDKANMAGLYNVMLGESLLVYLHLEAVKSEEVLVVKLIMVKEYIVVYSFM